ncbi:MAG: hypothetical protein HZA53_17210 [Planctomycetes bacterium]|nr:hypothetical protein [Planctomycetota bacterium]
MKWDYPVYREHTEKSDATTVKLRKALPYDEALKYVTGNDPRPLLVLRECKTCNKTDNALLRAGASDNEKTVLYSRWFHCVKLPVDVIQDDHPFNALFKNNDAPHFFVATRDGADMFPLETATSRSELWSSMSKVLVKSYKKDPTGCFQDVQHELDRLDVLDARVNDLESQKNSLLETAGKLDASKIKKIDADLATAKKEIADITKAIEKFTKAEIKAAPKPAEPKAGE